MTGQCVCAEAFQPQLLHLLQDPDVESLPYAAMPICICIRIYPVLVWSGLLFHSLKLQRPNPTHESLHQENHLPWP